MLKDSSLTQSKVFWHLEKSAFASIWTIFFCCSWKLEKVRLRSIYSLWETSSELRTCETCLTYWFSCSHVPAFSGIWFTIQHWRNEYSESKTWGQPLFHVAANTSYLQRAPASVFRWTYVWTVLHLYNWSVRFFVPGSGGRCDWSPFSRSFVLINASIAQIFSPLWEGDYCFSLYVSLVLSWNIGTQLFAMTLILLHSRYSAIRTTEWLSKCQLIWTIASNCCRRSQKVWPWGCYSCTYVRRGSKLKAKRCNSSQQPKFHV